MTMCIRGDAVSSTSLYALYKKVAGDYECIATTAADNNGDVGYHDGIFFDLDAYEDVFSSGDNILAVKAHGDGHPYKDSLYSNEVTHNVTSDPDLSNKCILKLEVDLGTVGYGDIDVRYVNNNNDMYIRAHQLETSTIVADCGSVFELTQLDGNSIYFGSMGQYEQATTDNTNGDDIVAFVVPATPGTYKLSFDHS